MTQSIDCKDAGDPVCTHSHSSNAGRKKRIWSGLLLSTDCHIKYNTGTPFTKGKV
jgi:hypothetical protein